MNQTVFSKVKSNKAFMILSALGILFVVDAHSGLGIGPFRGVFPYGSFFMPLFMFISGYFWKEKYTATWSGVAACLGSKFRKLMVPYLGWAVFYGVLVRILNSFGMHWPELNLRDFVYSAATDGTTFGINGAAWFVPALFAVTAVYTVLRKCLGRCWKDGVMLLLFMALGAVTVAVTGGGICHKALIFYKIGFFLPFFQLGYFFGKRLERWFDSVNTLGMCIVLALINVLLLAGDMPIDMGRLAFLSDLSADHCLLPLITSVTGIFFWLKIAKFLVPVLGESKLVNYISSHTFFIMMHHLLFIQIFGALLYGGMALGIPSLAGFDPAAFRGDPWYLYLPGEWMKAAYFLFSITGTTLACKGFDWLKLRCGRGKF